MEAMHEIDQVSRFHDEIIAAIAGEAPELAERILVKIGRIAEHWAPSS
jgi:hypothetical protein